MDKKEVIPIWFPKYIDLSKDDIHKDIWVLRNLVDDHTAYYWKVSGEWGRQIKYNGFTYQIQVPFGDIMESECLNPTTPKIFLENNTQMKTYWSIAACQEAWEYIKENNPLAKEITWGVSQGGYWYHTETYYNNKYMNWNL